MTCIDELVVSVLDDSFLVNKVSPIYILHSELYMGECYKDKSHVRLDSSGY